jgi:ferredoxin
MTVHAEVHLVVDGAKCDGHGICALVMPEMISLDTWGFATLDGGPLVDARSIARARRAVRACPAGALALVGDPRFAPPRGVTSGSLARGAAAASATPVAHRGARVLLALRGRGRSSSTSRGTVDQNEGEL